MIRILQFNDSIVWPPLLESVRHGLRFVLRPRQQWLKTPHAATGSHESTAPHRGHHIYGKRRTWILRTSPACLDRLANIGRRADVSTRPIRSGITTLGALGLLRVYPRYRVNRNAARESFPGRRAAGDGWCQWRVGALSKSSCSSRAAGLSYA